MEGSGDASISMMPKFYSNKWDATFNPTTVLLTDTIFRPNFIFFCGKKDLKLRVNYYKKKYQNIFLFRVCEPSLIDGIVHNLNPRNVNEYIEVWKVN